MGKTDTTLEHSVNVSQNLSKGDREHAGLWETGVKKQTAVGAWKVRRKGGMLALAEKDAPAPREGRKRQKLQASQSPTRICRICSPRGLCSPVRKQYWRRRSCLRKSWYLALLPYIQQKVYIQTSAFQELTFIAIQCWSPQFWAISGGHFKQLTLVRAKAMQEILHSLGLYFLFRTFLPLFSQSEHLHPSLKKTGEK